MDYKYMTSSQFTRDFTYSQRNDFARKYTGDEWDKPKRNIGNTRRCVVSKSAIRIAEVIKAKLDIDLFPLVIPIATKGWNIGGGTAAFAMYDKNNTEYLFGTRAAKFKSMKADYYERDFHANWIERG